MSNWSDQFKKDCEIAFNEEHWQKINYNTGCYEKRFANSRDNYRNAELEKQRAYILCNKSLMNMEKLLVDFETHFNEHGGNVLWARDAEDAQEMIYELVNRRDIKNIVRSNSVVLDEIGLNDFLKEKGIPLHETNVGRYVVQLAGQAPYHPMFAAMNFSKEEINGLLHQQFKLKLDSSSKQMVNFIRHQVSQSIAQSQVCITGANFLLSDVGGVALTEHEGNILKSCASAVVVARHGTSHGGHQHNHLRSLENGSRSQPDGGHPAEQRPIGAPRQRGDAAVAFVHPLRRLRQRVSHLQEHRRPHLRHGAQGTDRHGDDPLDGGSGRFPTPLNGMLAVRSLYRSMSGEDPHRGPDYRKSPYRRHRAHRRCQIRGFGQDDDRPLQVAEEDGLRPVAQTS